MRAFLAWATDGSSWRRILYLALALPLSTFYSAVIFSGLSVGLGVAILTLGLPLVLRVGLALGGALRALAVRTASGRRAAAAVPADARARVVRAATGAHRGR